MLATENAPSTERILLRGGTRDLSFITCCRIFVRASTDARPRAVRTTRAGCIAKINTTTLSFADLVSSNNTAGHLKGR